MRSKTVRFKMRLQNGAVQNAASKRCGLKAVQAQSVPPRAAARGRWGGQAVDTLAAVVAVRARRANGVLAAAPAVVAIAVGGESARVHYHGHEIRTSRP